MKRNIFIFVALIFLFFSSGVLANNQGIESADCNTKSVTDIFSVNTAVCMKFTTDGRVCNLIKGQDIHIYVVNHQPINFYQDGVDLLPIMNQGFGTKVNTLADPPYIFTNLGYYGIGGHDIIISATRDNKYHAGDCIDTQGSIIFNAGFDTFSDTTTTTLPSTTTTTFFVCNEGETRCGETDIDFLERCVGNKWFYQETCMFGCTSGECNPPITTTTAIPTTTTTQQEVTTTTIPLTTTTLPPTTGGQNMAWSVILLLIILAIIYYFREEIKKIFK